jgi:hypothetical protein
MAKGQKRSSREVKKPKADKNKPKTGAPATVASVTKKPAPTSGGTK